MLDTIEIAKKKGIEEGKLLEAKEILVDLFLEKFDMITPKISEQIINIKHKIVLKCLLRQVLKCSDIKEFEDILNIACSSETS